MLYVAFCRLASTLYAGWNDQNVFFIRRSDLPSHVISKAGRPSSITRRSAQSKATGPGVNRRFLIAAVILEEFAAFQSSTTGHEQGWKCAPILISWKSMCALDGYQDAIISQRSPPISGPRNPRDEV